MRAYTSVVAEGNTEKGDVTASISSSVTTANSLVIVSLEQLNTGGRINKQPRQAF